MYKFLARRIHDGFMKITDVAEKYQDKVRAAYLDLYGVAIIAEHFHVDLNDVIMHNSTVTVSNIPEEKQDDA